MSDDKKSVLLENLAVIMTPENVQKYILGSKKSGQPRAVYDIVRDYTKPTKRKKKKNGNKGENDNTYSLYLRAKKHKKKKKNKNKDKYWHI